MNTKNEDYITEINMLQDEDGIFDCINLEDDNITENIGADDFDGLLNEFDIPEYEFGFYGNYDRLYI